MCFVLRIGSLGHATLLFLSILIVVNCHVVSGVPLLEIEIKLTFVQAPTILRIFHLGSFQGLIHYAFRRDSCIFCTFGLFQQFLGQEGLLNLWLLSTHSQLGFRHLISALNGLRTSHLLFMLHLLLICSLLRSLTFIFIRLPVEIIYVCRSINVEDQGLSLTLRSKSSNRGNKLTTQKGL